MAGNGGVERWRDECGRWQMVGHGAKLSRNMDAAIAALLAQPSVAEAARVVGIGPQTLSRWMKVPEFDTAYRAAQRAVLGRAIARLQQASGTAVTALLKVMFDADAPKAARLAAAEVVLRHAKDANEIGDIQSRLSALARDTAASHGETAGLPANERGSSPPEGHGAKFGRKKEEAIAQLLTQRSVDEAARVTGIGTQTLYRWIRHPEFEAAYRAARRAAFGQASARLQQASGAAVSTILQILRDPSTPASTRVRAGDLTLTYGKAAMEEDIVVRLSELGYATETAQAILSGDRRSFNVIARKPPKLAA
jgi:transposase